MDGEEIGERRGFLVSNHRNLPRCFVFSSRGEEQCSLIKKKKVEIHGDTIGAAFLPPTGRIHSFFSISVSESIVSFPPRNLDKCSKLRVELR